jgi:hypothetical protein
VGDSSKLLNLCAENGFIRGETYFSGSLFEDIKKNGSSINILIGSKKFTTGWNCYRVSTMGLMNVGRSEGSQIIQIFGRGVRLRGYNKSLKRSAFAQREVPGLRPAQFLPLVETLNIFGIKANYMQQFRDYLRQEGVPVFKDITAPQKLNVLKNKEYKDKHLKKLKLKDGVNYVSKLTYLYWSRI